MTTYNLINISKKRFTIQDSTGRLRYTEVLRYKDIKKVIYVVEAGLGAATEDTIHIHMTDGKFIVIENDEREIPEYFKDMNIRFIEKMAEM